MKFATQIFSVGFSPNFTAPTVDNLPTLNPFRLCSDVRNLLLDKSDQKLFLGDWVLCPVLYRKRPLLDGGIDFINKKKSILI